MKNYLSNLFLFILCLSSIVFILFYDVKKEFLEYTDTFKCLNNNVYVKIYSTSEKKAIKTFLDIEKIYESYNILLDKNNSYDGINNLYYINYNLSNDEYIKIDKALYEMINYGKKVYTLSNGLVDISKGKIYDIWNSYQKARYGVPDILELQNQDIFDINDIKLKKGKILNNNVNIDFKQIKESYITSKVIEYFNKNNIDKYIINAGENISVGDNFNKDFYSIGISNPDNRIDVIKIVYGNNISVATIGSYVNSYGFNGFTYTDQINPKTLFPSDNFKSVTVVSNDINKSSYLANSLFLLSLEDGKKMIEKEKVTAIWYTNDYKIITIDNIKK